MLKTFKYPERVNAFETQTQFNLLKRQLTDMAC